MLKLKVEKQSWTEISSLHPKARSFIYYQEVMPPDLFPFNHQISLYKKTLAHKSKNRVTES